ncbi:hypothetical protein [Desulfatiglans anilini]|uniref:hypothetical protein n=1 Tax=Desulfatiglans anilini TaxID=90728 RepID=UPI0004215A57|nr:hypothetical protein [Desulfatiglans anilini]
MTEAKEASLAISVLDAIAEPFAKHFHHQVVKAFPPQSRLVRLWARCIWRLSVLREYLSEGENAAPERLDAFWDEQRRLAKASWDRSGDGFGWEEHLKAFADAQDSLKLLAAFQEDHIRPRFSAQTKTLQAAQLACAEFETLASHMNPEGCSKEMWDVEKRFWKSARSRNGSGCGPQPKKEGVTN